MRVIAYLRVSTEQQDTERQLIQIQNYCIEHNHTIVKVIEDKISGAKADRKGLNELLTVTDETADFVIVSEQSRFSRESNILKVLVNISNVLDNGLDLMFLDDNTKVFKAYTELDEITLITLIIGAKAANAEKDKIKYRMISGKDAIFEKDIYASIDTFTPYGYDITPNPLYKDGLKVSKHIITPNNKEVEIIKEIFSLYVNDSMSIKKIEQYYKARNIILKATHINYILKNRMYIGERWRKGKLVHRIEPILDIELFNAAQSKAKDNLLIKNNSRVYINPFKGFIKCSCGSSMYLQQLRDKLNYRCFDKARNKRNNCTNTSVSLDIIVKCVNDALKRTSQYKEFDERTNNEIFALNRKIELLQQSITVNNKTISDLNYKIENTINAIADTSVKTLRDALTAKYNGFIDELNKAKEYNDNAVNDIQVLNKRITDLEITGIKYKEYSLDELKDISSKIISNITYYSYSTMKGVVSITFKNNITMYYLIRKSSGINVSESIYSIPDTFTFNPETMLFNIDVMLQQTEMSFNMVGMFETRYYNYEQLKEAYNIDEWLINKTA